jgi:hypothetical protein
MADWERQVFGVPSLRDAIALCEWDLKGKPGNSIRELANAGGTSLVLLVLE